MIASIRYMPSAITLTGDTLTFGEAMAIAAGASVQLHPKIKRRLARTHQTVKELGQGEKPIYSINTGFGGLAKERISKDNLVTLQRNIILSHAAGYGPPLAPAETRLAMALRLNVMVQGFSGCRFELCKRLARFINSDILSIVPSFGSVGASGDLIPLAHLALPLIGEGQVVYKGKRISAQTLHQRLKIKPMVLQEKEGLALINGTQIMLALGALALKRARALAELADKIVALSYEALGGLTQALDVRAHAARKQKGQITSAQNIRRALDGSYLFSPHAFNKRVQDPYSLRCAPQVHGPAHDALEYTLRIVERELNAATDNPLIFGRSAVSAGNFHGQALALVFDFAGMATSELANISERRLELLMNPSISGLPPFLTPAAGLNSGYMSLQYLCASLVNENKILSHPASTDSIPGNLGVEDHVSMGMAAARKFKTITEQARIVLAAELLAACQAIDLRGIKQLGKGTKGIYRAVRSQVPTLRRDRIVAYDIERAVAVLDHLVEKTHAFSITR